MLTGWKTIIVGLVMAVAPIALDHLAHVDWTSLGLSPSVAFAISGAVMLLMRYFTATPITKPNAVASVAAMPDVIKIITAATPAGRALADEVPGDAVVTATEARRHA